MTVLVGLAIIKATMPTLAMERLFKIAHCPNIFIRPTSDSIMGAEGLSGAGKRHTVD